MISKTALARSIASMGRAEPRPYMIPFAGGLDLETPPLSLPSGFLRGAQNWECDLNGGYARVLGYERVDGRTAPSAGTASVIDITLTGSISVGDTVTGAITATTAVVIAVPDSGHIVVTKVSGLGFNGAEVLNVGGNPQATSTSTAHGASTALLRAQYKNLAADEYRDDIAAPTGSGSSLGGIKFGGVLYTFRNNAGGTAAGIWKSSATGWQAVTLYNEVSFTAGGTTEPAEGATLTQGAVTATIKRVVRESGTFAGSTAAGRLIVANPAGGNFAAGAATVGAINFTLSGAQTAITLLPDGRYEMVVDNFGGTANTSRIYGCDGVNRGFEFDGDVFVPIATGMATDAPTHVHVHMMQLFFSFGASVQHSGPGTPYIWSVVLGAAELGMGDTVSGFQSQPGSTGSGALAIFTRNRMSVLYGTGVSNWQLTPYRKELGAYPYTIQDTGYTTFLDDRGVQNLYTAQEFGNFSHTALSARIRTWLNGKRTKSVASCICRDKDQYRLFFSDGYVLYTTFERKKVVGMMPVKLPNAATWAWSSEESDGAETIYFGSTNGMVYQMEKGTSFDGTAIAHNIKLSWDFLRSPGLIKKYHSAVPEITGTGYAEFSFGYKVGYASTDILQPITLSETVSFSSGVWDEAGVTWDSGITWDGTTLAPSVLDMGSEAENVSLIFSGSSDYHESIRFSGARVMYSPRRYQRLTGHHHG